MTAHQYLAKRLEDFVVRYTGQAVGFDEPVVQAAEAVVDDAVRKNAPTLKQALDQYEQSLILTEVIA